VNGIVVLDKPAGISSARTVAEVKRAAGAAKAGHTGTLDPFATGVLICCLNRATRLARFFLHGDKCYEAVLRLGAATDTQDATGRVVARGPLPVLSDSTLAAVFSRFEGRQLQQPPAYAALKHQGQPLYKLARQGTPVNKAPRPVTVSGLRIIQVALPDIRFAMTCSAGTYVRALCDDIGQAIGCGGHLARLRRTASSGFTIAEAVSLETLREVAGAGALHRVVVPMAEALRDMPVFEAGADLLETIAQGRPLSRQQVQPQGIEKPGTHHPNGYIKVVDDAGDLKAVLQPCPDGHLYNYCCVFN
jgi:tRNA pseudouridine55 synthase